MTARTPNTFVVGAGPVATALAGALRLGGVPVLGLWARRPEAARAAGAISGVGTYSAAPPDLLLEASVVILAVRDDAIGEVAEMLAATGLITSRHTMLHCSGALSAEDAFGALRGRVGGIGTLHPLRAIADGRLGMQQLADTTFGIEGDGPGLARAKDLVGAIGGRTLELSGAQMAVYHAAAAVASNYVVTLLDVAAQLLLEGGLPEGTSLDDAVAALTPLAAGAIANVAERGTIEGLTGPIRRGDQATVAKHLEAIPASLRGVYRELGLMTVQLARRGDATAPSSLDAIETLLRAC